MSETIPDNTTFSGGDDFTKPWTLKNIGTCSWTPSYSLVFVSGDALAGPANVSLATNVNPGQNITVTVNLEAPDANGTYHGNWGLRNAAGVIFSSFWVQVKVASGGGDGKFAVTYVFGRLAVEYVHLLAHHQAGDFNLTGIRYIESSCHHSAPEDSRF